MLALKIIDKIVEGYTPIFNVMYFYGNVENIGALLEILLERYKDARPDARILRTNAEDFCKDTFQYILNQDNCMPECDLYVFENIEKISGLETNEQRLYGVLDWLLENKRQIIISGTLPVALIGKLSPRIRAQIDGGISLGIE